MENSEKTIEPVHLFRIKNLERKLASMQIAERRKFLADTKLKGNYIWQLRQEPGTKHWRGLGFVKARDLEAHAHWKTHELDAEISLQQQEELGQNRATPQLDAVRSGNNVRAIRLAVQSLFNILSEKTPDVAKAVAADLRASAGTEFSGQGFLSVLLGILEEDHGIAATVTEVSPLPQVLKSSKRARAG